MTDPAPITQDGTTVVIRGEALPLLYRAVFALTLHQHRDGIAPSPLLAEALRVLYRATTSRSRHPLDATTLAPASCNGQHGDLIGIAEAAEVLPDAGPF